MVFLSPERFFWIFLGFGVFGFLATNPVFGGWTNHFRGNGLDSDNIRAMAVDDSNFVWVATPSAGVAYYDGTAWGSLNKNHGLADEDVHYVVVYRATNPDQKWFGTDVGVSLYEDTAWTNYDTTDGLVGRPVISIFIDNAGNKWFGTAFSGVSKFDGASTWTTYDTSNGLPENTVTAILQDSGGNFWFGTDKGLAKFDGVSTWTVFDTANSGLLDNQVNDLALDSNENLWIGTNGGLN